MEKEQYIVALEIGSSKIIGAVATLNPRGGLSVIGLEEEKVVDCVRYGCIQNVEETNTRINRIIKKLENRESIYPRKIKGVFVGIGGRSLRSVITEVERALNGETPITERIIEDIKRESISVPISGFDILDSVPRRYIIDKVEAKSPVGMIGSHISAKLSLIVAKPQIKANIKRVLEERLQLAVKGFLVTPICTAEEVLTSDERQLGCVLIDFGAETTTISIYKNNTLLYLSTLPLGSRNITRDLTSLSLVEEKAEDIKKTIGTAMLVDGEASRLNVEGVNAGEVTNYIVARAEEIVANINAQISYAEITPDNVPGGIILIGGGAKLNGFTTLLEQQTKIKVRRGTISDTINVLDRKITVSDYPQIISILAKGATIIKPNDDCCEMPPDVPQLHRQESVDVKKEVKPQQPKTPGTFRKLIDKLKVSAEGMFAEDKDGDDDENDNDK
ncbi:MAG: cell division protein FtsA [Muribaculaceae bacterium]